MNFITVFQTFSLAEAQIVRGRLETDGFHPEVVNEIAAVSMDGYSMAVGGVLIQVPEAEGVAAREVIEASENSTP